MARWLSRDWFAVQSKHTILVSSGSKLCWLSWKIIWEHVQKQVSRKGCEFLWIPSFRQKIAFVNKRTFILVFPNCSFLCVVIRHLSLMRRHKLPTWKSSPSSWSAQLKLLLIVVQQARDLQDHCIRPSRHNCCSVTYRVHHDVWYLCTFFCYVGPSVVGVLGHFPSILCYLGSEKTIQTKHFRTICRQQITTAYICSSALWCGFQFFYIKTKRVRPFATEFHFTSLRLLTHSWCKVAPILLFGQCGWKPPQKRKLFPGLGKLSHRSPHTAGLKGKRHCQHNCSIYGMGIKKKISSCWKEVLL